MMVMIITKTITLIIMIKGRHGSDYIVYQTFV